MDWLTIFAQVLAILAVFYFYIKHKLSYWSKKGVPHLEGNPLTLGINFKLFSQGPEIYTKDQFERCGKVYGVASAFRNVLVVNDAELIKQIMIKDFHLFMDKPTQGTWDDMWNLNLFMSGGDAWKRIRTIVSPTFTSGKLRAMHSVMHNCVKMLVNHLENVANPSAEVNIKEVITGFTIDVIAIFLMPMWFNNLLGIRSQFDPEHFDFFGNLVKEIVKQRKSGQKRGNDFVQLLMDAYATDNELKELNFEKLIADMDKDENTSFNEKKRLESSKNSLSDSEIAAQFETTSSTITHLLYELALNPTVQERLREDLVQALGDLDVTSEEYFDVVMNGLPYLEAVTKETLRKYPPLIRLERRLSADSYKLNGIPIEKSTNVVVSSYAVHHNAEYYPNPESFDPERFMPENKHKLVPYTYLPFGTGTFFT
ncbi:PREDICTED: cytochrome P450 3A41-like [Rhagoletis zephyria]|uniref:cytochrome P450 3A41-like n=1 Tax=Rhagoletis zephyria TaxID=28612 RepID=UPI0008113933|nr:PREDICTED: cytochrome P450 3A41-like [Rhagoletis zephyria]